MSNFWKTMTLCIFMTGCSSVINRPVVLDTSPATSISLDAKQRMVIAIDRTDENGKKSRTVCAEASPDAVEGIATALAAGVNGAGDEGGQTIGGHGMGGKKSGAARG